MFKELDVTIKIDFFKNSGDHHCSWPMIRMMSVLRDVATFVAIFVYPEATSASLN
jgi:hypothetical protein